MATTLAPDELQKKQNGVNTFGLCCSEKRWEKERPSPSEKCRPRSICKFLQNKVKQLIESCFLFYFHCFTYCRAWLVSCPRSAATTETRWRNFSAGRRLNPWPRSSTTTCSCCSYFTGHLISSSSLESTCARPAPRDASDNSESRSRMNPAQGQLISAGHKGLQLPAVRA